MRASVRMAAGRRPVRSAMAPHHHAADGPQKEADAIDAEG